MSDPVVPPAPLDLRTRVDVWFRANDSRASGYALIKELSAALLAAAPERPHPPLLDLPEWLAKRCWVCGEAANVITHHPPFNYDWCHVFVSMTDGLRAASAADRVSALTSLVAETRAKAQRWYDEKAFGMSDALHLVADKMAALLTASVPVVDEGTGPPRERDEWVSALTVLGHELVDRYTKRQPVAERHGGCGWCGGLPHTTECLVGRFAALLDPAERPASRPETIAIDPR